MPGEMGGSVKWEEDPEVTREIRREDPYDFFSEGYHGVRKPSQNVRYYRPSDDRPIKPTRGSDSYNPYPGSSRVVGRPNSFQCGSSTNGSRTDGDTRSYGLPGQDMGASRTFAYPPAPPRPSGFRYSSGRMDSERPKEDNLQGMDRPGYSNGKGTDEKDGFFKIPGVKTPPTSRERPHERGKPDLQVLSRPKNSKYIGYAVFMIISGFPEFLLLSFISLLFLQTVLLCFAAIPFFTLIALKITAMVLLFLNRAYKATGTLLLIQGSLVLLIALAGIVLAFMGDNDLAIVVCFGTGYLALNSIITLLLGASVISIGKSEERKMRNMAQNVSSFSQ